jgi:hypothetical protein
MSLWSRAQEYWRRDKAEEQERQVAIEAMPPCVAVEQRSVQRPEQQSERDLRQRPVSRGRERQQERGGYER